jgi:hypothetical protein
VVIVGSTYDRSGLVGLEDFGEEGALSRTGAGPASTTAAQDEGDGKSEQGTLKGPETA